MNDDNLEVRILKDGCEVVIDHSSRGSQCKKCYKSILWAITKENGKSIPVEQTDDGRYICHFKVCPFFKKN